MSHSSSLLQSSGTLTKHLSPAELAVISKKRNKEVEKKKRELQQTGQTILELKDEISHISVKLKEKRMKEKDFRVSTTRFISHEKTLEIDRHKRPADRDYEIRNYSKMDMDVWRYDQVRNWFNSYATEQEPYRFVPSETGYTLKKD